MTKKDKRGGFLVSFLTLCLLTGLTVGYLSFHFDESPLKTWEQLVRSVGNQPETAPEPPALATAAHEPEPISAPEPEVVFEPAPELEPEIVEQVTPAPAPVLVQAPEPVDPVEWLISHKSRWPRHVALQDTVEFPAVYDNRVVGSVKVPAASKLSVIAILAEGLDIEYMGVKRRLPYQATNIATLAQVAMKDAKTEAAAPPKEEAPSTVATPAPVSAPAIAPKNVKGIDAWTAVGLMSPGINIGNTFDSTSGWETGWGNPTITRDFVKALADQGFKSIRLPVAWDTYANDGEITREQFERVEEVVDWILGEGLFCVVNIHWDGGWIDSGDEERYPDTYHTFSADAETKFRSYWTQISRRFADKDEKLIFEAFNEETNFSKVGTMKDAYATLTRVNQLFIDTVRKTGGHNATRLIIVPGYTTDFAKTSHEDYKLPKDTVPGKMFVSVHYYTPWSFVGLNEDASWGKMQLTWGSDEDVKQLEELFDLMEDYCMRNDIPAYIGEFSLCSDKDRVSGIKWTSSVMNAALKRKMVPVLWDTGGAISRNDPFKPSDILTVVLQKTRQPVAATEKARK